MRYRICIFRNKEGTVTKIEYAAISEKGKRPTNQDAVFAASLKSCAVFVVADGMGGHSYGEVASREIVKGIAEWWEYVHHKTDSMSIEEAVTQCKEELSRINTELYMKYAVQGVTVGSTLALLLLWRDSFATLSVGDSHIYRVEKNNAVALTRDDIWDNLPEIRNALSQKEKEKHPSHEKLTAAIGPLENVKINEGRGFMENREDFLVCSDGVYKYVEVKDLSKYMTAKLFGLQSVLLKLKRRVLANMTKDNYSMILCRVR